MSRMTWLHLSDWHQNSPHGSFDRTVVLNALIEDIRNRAYIDPSLANIDFIVFSGDIAWQGKAKDYADALDQFFMPILDAAGLGPDGWKRLFVVPGNHDIDRDKLPSVDKLLEDVDLDDSQGIAEQLKREWVRKGLLDPFQDYVDWFLSKHPFGNLEGKFTERSYYFSTVLNVAGKRIAIVGLNSAWLSARKKDSQGRVVDYGYLAIGEPQIFDALQCAENADLRIAVMHHPFEWLRESDRTRAEERLWRGCHFILCGHQHRPRVNVLRSTLSEVIIIPGGASYDRRIPRDPRYANAYNFVCVDFAAGQGTVFLRRWSDSGGTWVKDAELWEGGRFPFLLPKEGERSPDQRTALQQVVSKYGRDARQRFYDSVNVSVEQRVEDRSGVRFVLHRINFRLRIAPGPREVLNLRTFSNQRVMELIRARKLDMRPYVECHFKLNNQDVRPISESETHVQYSVELEETSSEIEYGFTLYEMTDGAYNLVLERFTKSLTVTLHKAEQLQYELLRIGKFHYHGRLLDPMNAVELTATELVWPDQGFLYQWWPRGT